MRLFWYSGGIMKMKKTVLKNGLRVITVPMADNPTVTVMVMVAAGGRYETLENNGISHFLEHMCFKGTEKRTNQQIVQELDGLGAETNAFTSHDYTGYYAKGRTGTFSKLIEVVSDVYLNSTFPEAEIEKERGVICGEIDMYKDVPQRKVIHLFNESLYGDQPAGRMVLGPKENIMKFTRADFAKYRNDHYIAEKTAIVVVGNINHQNVTAEVKKFFAGIKTGKKISKKKLSSVTGPAIIVGPKKTDQSHIMLGVRTVSLDHPDYSPLSVMSGVLGQGMSSRLFMKLREEMGAGYYVRTSLGGADDGGDFDVATGTEHARVEEVVSAIMQEIARMRNELVPDDELIKTKEFLVGGAYMGLESTESIAYHIAYHEIIDQSVLMPRDIEKKIRAVSAADIKRVAQKYLKPERFHLAIIGDHVNQKSLEKLLKH